MHAKSAALWLSLAFVVGCGSRQVPTLPDEPEQVFLYSLDGCESMKRRAEERDREQAEQADRGKAPKAEPKAEAPKPDTLHGWTVLGKVELTGADRQKVITLTRDAIRHGPDQPARCFIPRHAVRIVKDGKTTDVVICFECSRYYLFRDGQREQPEGPTVSASAQSHFDKLLTDAGIPLAPKE